MNEDPFRHYVELTPERLSLSQLIECVEQLDRFSAEPLRLMLAAKAAHLGLQSALTAALAGSANIGAYRERTRIKWLQWFDDSRDNDAPAPADTFVMHFEDLLDAAETAYAGTWLSEPLVLTDADKTMLARLTFLRHSVEHVKPQSHLIEPLFVWECIPTAVQLTAQLLTNAVPHHFEEDDLASVRQMAAKIEAQACAATGIAA